jgi:nitroreductase
MEISEAIRRRRSVRRFLDKEIPEDAVSALIEAMRWAPSSGNIQARKFYFVFDRDTKKRIVDAALKQTFIADAPLVVVACADYNMIRHYGERGRNLYVIQDVAVAVENMMLQAVEFGLGTVWVGAFEDDAVKRILKMPTYLSPLALVPVGYPEKEPHPPSRYDAHEFVKIVR